MKAELEAAAEKNFQSLLRQHECKLVREEAYDLGALKDYEGDDFIVRVINDKGIVSIEVAGKASPQGFQGIASYKTLREPPAQGSWNLSHREQVEYLETNWQWFSDHLGKKP